VAWFLFVAEDFVDWLTAVPEEFVFDLVSVAAEQRSFSDTICSESGLWEQ